MKKTVYVSGAKGFIGSAVKVELQEKGYSVIDDEYYLEQIDKLRKHDIDVIVHCAAMVGTVECNKRPDIAAITNVKGTWEIAKIAKEKNAKFVYISSISVYDFSNITTLITESSIIKPHTWYGMTKYLGEKAAECVFGSEFLNLRLGFIYGNPEKDPHSVISGIIKGQKVPLVGRYSKDYLYVVDCAEAIVKLIEADCNGVYNIGSEDSYSIPRIVEYLGNSEFEYDDEGDYYKNFRIRRIKLFEDVLWIPRVNFWYKIKELKEVIPLATPQEAR